MGSGNPAALRDFNATQKAQLGELIKLTQQSNMNKGDRRRVMCMITLDAHNRDLIEKLISEGKGVSWLLDSS
jgi:dynein heavy chain